eukprot:2474684-Rhodomonas_salina.1
MWGTETGMMGAPGGCASEVQIETILLRCPHALLSYFGIHRAHLRAAIQCLGSTNMAVPTPYLSRFGVLRAGVRS